MTKQELLKLLEDFDDDNEIYFAYPSGDYWRHTIVKSVDSLECLKTIYSDYTQSKILFDEENDNDNDELNSEYSIVLR